MALVIFSGGSDMTSGGGFIPKKLSKQVEEICGHCPNCAQPIKVKIHVDSSDKRE